MANRKTSYSEAIRLYQSGMSVQDVADFYGVSRQAMWVWMRRRGVQLRSQIRQGEQNHFYRRGQRADKRAIHLVEKAVKKGVLIQPTLCEKCGKDCALVRRPHQIEAHHDDYGKPLTVRWLCRECHFAWHKTHRAIPAL